MLIVYCHTNILHYRNYWAFTLASKFVIVDSLTYSLFFEKEWIKIDAMIIGNIEYVEQLKGVFSMFLYKYFNNLQGFYLGIDNTFSCTLVLNYIIPTTVVLFSQETDLTKQS